MAIGHTLPLFNVVRLYGSRFVCRLCTRVHHWTQTASPDARLAQRIRRLQERLAPEVDVDDFVIDLIPGRRVGCGQHPTGGWWIC